MTLNITRNEHSKGWILFLSNLRKCNSSDWISRIYWNCALLVLVKISLFGNQRIWHSFVSNELHRTRCGWRNLCLAIFVNIYLPSLHWRTTNAFHVLVDVHVVILYALLILVVWAIRKGVHESCTIICSFAEHACLFICKSFGLWYAPIISHSFYFFNYN